MTAFRLLTMDLLVLFHCMNEGMVNILGEFFRLSLESKTYSKLLEHFFEMSKTDAERTLRVYRTFVRQTDLAVKYFSVARNYEHVTRLEIPKIRHAPTSLAGQLEEYVKDNDFDVMRRQYIAQQQAKKGGKATNGSSNKLFDEKPAPKKAEPFPEPKGPPAASSQQKGPAPDLIDFFASIEQNQTQMNTNPFQQPQFAQQNAPVQTGFQQPQATGFQQPQVAGFQQHQQQAFPDQNTGMPSQQQPFSPVNGQGTNPFQQMQQPPQLQQQQQQQQQQQLEQQQQMQIQQQQLQQHQLQQQQMQQAQQIQQPQQLQPNFTGAGFGGYTPQPQPQQQNRFTPGLSSIPQNAIAPFQQQSFATGSTDTSNSTNPFRQSILPNATGASTNSFSSSATPISQQSTNPFAKSSPTPSNQPFSATTSQFSNLSLNTQQQPQPLMPAVTGTNPFARMTASPASSSPFSATPTGVSTNVTGSTNPFRQSQFVNQQTGQGWQSGPQGTIGGMNPEQLPTMPVFPRPGQQQQQNTGWQG
jgi:hypothetical protein